MHGERLKAWLVIWVSLLLQLTTSASARSAGARPDDATRAQRASSVLHHSSLAPPSAVSSSCAQRAAVPNGNVHSDSRRRARRASTALGETARPQAPPRTREWGQPCSDENGNLTGKDTQSLAYDSGNRVRQVGDVVFERDANGQMVRQTSPERDDRYDWDALGQLTCAKHRDGGETRFGYDAFGRRVFKEHQPAPPKTEAPDPIARFAWAKTPLPGEPRGRADTAPRHVLEGRTEYFWAGDDLLAEVRSSGLTEYAMWGFVADALWEDGQLRHVVHSQQGVPQELVDGGGKLVWQGVFDDWGKLVDERGESTCRLRLPGQIADDETGLHYNRFRYYAPDAGQFVSADPIGFKAGPNHYRFAPNSVNHSDHLGLTCPNNACQIPDDANVVRGGVTTPEQIGRGIGPHRDVPGLTGFSAQSRAGASVDSLAATGGVGGGPFPHGQVSVTTAGQLRSIGCEVVPSPGGGANHVTVVPGSATPAQISQQFTPRPNPARQR